MMTEKFSDMIVICFGKLMSIYTEECDFLLSKYVSLDNNLDFFEHIRNTGKISEKEDNIGPLPKI